MWRDYDPRPDERERPDLSRGSRGASDERALSSTDPRDVFTRSLDLPRGTSRRRVRVRDHSFELRASEVRILATTGAFRVVPAKDLVDHREKPADARTRRPPPPSRGRIGPHDALRRGTREDRARHAH